MIIINYDWFLEINKLAKEKIGHSNYRVTKLHENGKTCFLEDLDKHKEACMDLVHIIALVKEGSMYITNPSRLKNRLNSFSNK